MISVWGVEHVRKSYIRSTGKFKPITQMTRAEKNALRRGTSNAGRGGARGGNVNHNYYSPKWSSMPGNKAGGTEQFKDFKQRVWRTLPKNQGFMGNPLRSQPRSVLQSAWRQSQIATNPRSAKNQAANAWRNK